MFLLSASANAAETSGQVVDIFTDMPIKGVFVTLNDEVSVTDENGMFSVKAAGDALKVRAYGYLRFEQPIVPVIATPILIRLIPFTPKGLYLSFYGVGDKRLRESAVSLADETEINAVVIDVKGDRGMLSYKSSLPLASEIGAQRIITIKDIKGLIESLNKRGIYTIARIVAFKDNSLAIARPDLAIKTQAGEIWRDYENLAWVDPFRKEVWEYNIDIAVEAAQYGFDEIQFDYARFPEESGLRYSAQNTEKNRVKAVTGFLSEARKRLVQHNVFLAADIFGYVCWNVGDTQIGQRLEDLAPVLDYISPMLYPSGFQYGIPASRNPVADPYKTVYLSLKRAQERTIIPSIRFRPWLQAFRDYAFDRRAFGEKEIREQIRAAEDFNSNGWMLWNPQNIYSPKGLKGECSN